MAKEITWRQLPNGEWEASRNDVFARGETKEKVLKLLDYYDRVMESSRFCRYCGSAIDYCICTSLAD